MQHATREWKNEGKYFFAHSNMQLVNERMRGSTCLHTAICNMQLVNERMRGSTFCTQQYATCNSWMKEWGEILFCTQQYVGLAKSINIYTVYVRYFWRGNHQINGHIRCINTVLANPSNMQHATCEWKNEGKYYCTQQYATCNLWIRVCDAEHGYGGVELCLASSLIAFGLSRVVRRHNKTGASNQRCWSHNSKHSCVTNGTHLCMHFPCTNWEMY
jgi:hypothetical protein